MEKRTESINLNISPNRGPMKVLRAFGRLAFFVLFVPYGPLLLPLLSNRNRAQMQKRNFNLEPKNEILEESKGEGVRWSIANELAGLTPGLVGADIEVKLFYVYIPMCVRFKKFHLIIWPCKTGG